MAFARSRALPLMLETALKSASALAIALVLPAPALADGAVGAPSTTNAFGLDASFVLPLGDYGDVADASIGALVRLEIGITPLLWITGRLGYLRDLGTGDSTTIQHVPLYGGVKAQLSGSGGFGYAELGPTYSHVTIEGPLLETSSSETNIGLTAGIGFQQAPLQGRFGLWLPSLEDADQVYGIMVSVGFDL